MNTKPRFPAQAVPGECGWFALCERPATTTRPHPILGDVPTCDRCAARVDHLMEKTK